jgi:hypothetical protein
LAALIGTPSRLTIRSSDGSIIVREGEIVTPGVISSALDAGRGDELRLAAKMAARSPKIRIAGEFEEMGVEEPTGIRPD